MSPSPQKVRNRKRNEATTQNHDRFIQRHRSVLQRYVDGMAPASAAEPDALGYIESVLTEWQDVFGRSDLSDPSSEERVFWLALYLLEELAESPGSEIDPYERFLIENLIEARELLRHRRVLPEHRFTATRPNGT